MIYVDEAEVHLNPPCTRIWAPVGEPAKIPSAGDNRKAVVYGGWDYENDNLVSQISQKKNSKEFIQFLDHIDAEMASNQKLKLVMDNAGYHKANRVKEKLRQKGDRFEVFWLPPYSPNLNLIERVWKYLKENVTNNYFFGNIDSLISATEHACESMKNTADKLLEVNFKTGKDLVRAA